MAESPLAVLRFFTMGRGAQCVMMTGISMMLMWSVGSWASFVHPGLLGKQSTVRGLVLPGWMTSGVKETRYRYYSAAIEEWEMRTVAIARMQVWSVK